MATTPQPIPVEIRRAGEHDVEIRWTDGRVVVYPARFLRLQCPCAMCVEETSGRRVLQEVSVPADVHPVAIEPVGRYAICIGFSDGHNTGIYTWEHLHTLADALAG